MTYATKEPTLTNPPGYLLARLAAQRQEAHQREAELWRNANLAEAARPRRYSWAWDQLKRAMTSLHAASLDRRTPDMSRPRP